MVNYFWLSYDPEESASWYCDQHCFKIGSEVVESVWDAILTLSPHLSIKADGEGISHTYRKRRHAKPDSLWHPLSVWHGLCLSNMKRGLINANAIFKEHMKRTGTSHKAWEDCRFLLDNVDVVDFNCDVWMNWFSSQNGSTDTPFTPSKTKKPDLVKRKLWIDEFCPTILHHDRNTCTMTEPPQCINEDIPEFSGCRVRGDVIEAYRRYYNAKIKTVSGGMRYFYTKPPSWLDANVITKRSSSKKYDSEGFLIVNLPD